MLPNETLNALTNGRNGFEYTVEGHAHTIGGEDGIELLRLHMAYSCLKLEVKTGLKYSNRFSTLAVVNQMLGTNYKRKAPALAHIEQILELAGELRQNEEAE
jgi:hypothetical protein